VDTCSHYLIYSARAVADIASRTTYAGAGAEIDVKRVPELMSPEIAKQASTKPEQSAAVARPGQLADYDAIIT
jgi:hypothetical protein